MLGDREKFLSVKEDLVLGEARILEKKRSVLSMCSTDEEDGANDSRRVWTREEDAAIRTLVVKFGVKSWAAIAEKIATVYDIQGRTGKQCRERWHNHLDPEIMKSPWSTEEEELLSRAHAELGNRWSEIAKRLPGRTDNHVKNHWYSFMRRTSRRENREAQRSRHFLESLSAFQPLSCVAYEVSPSSSPAKKRKNAFLQVEYFAQDFLVETTCEAI